MRLLLDTHALLWWLLGDRALSRAARNAIDDPGSEVFVSAVSGWELSTKNTLGRLPSAGRLLPGLAGFVADQGFLELPITLRDGERAGRLPLVHRDPFDRMLIAQAITRQLIIVSNESLFEAYGVDRLW